MSSLDPTEARREAAAHDAELVSRIAGHESDPHDASDALSNLYDRFAGLLLAVSRRILNSQEEAEDVLQDVFVQVWNQASRYESTRSSVSTWLSLIARSRSIDRLRSRQVQDRTAQSAHEENPPEDASPEGVGNVLHQERRKRLLGVLSELPEEQRGVLELAFFGGMTQSEISASTGTPLGTVKTRTLLAMRKLRKALEADVEELL